MGHGHKRKLESKPEIMQWNHCFPVDHAGFSHMLTSINWWSLQREKATHIAIKQAKGKLEQKMVYHIVTYNFTVQDAYVNQSCYDL